MEEKEQIIENPDTEENVQPEQEQSAEEQSTAEDEDTIRKKGKKKKMSAGVLWGMTALLVCTVLVVGAALVLAFRGSASTVGDAEVALTVEAIPVQEEMVNSTSILQTVGETEPGNETEEESLAESAEEEKIPGEESWVEVPEDERKGYVKVESCLVLPGSGQLGLKAKVDALPASDDQYLYLFALETFQDAVPEGAEPIAQTEKSLEFVLQADINESQADSRLYHKFVVAMKEDDQYVVLSTPKYITNPEALAGFAAAYPQKASIKGLLVDPLKIATTELEELGVKHAVYNIPLDRILGPTTNGYFPTINYSYNGKNYVLNGAIIDEYDFVFRNLTQKGIVINAVLLNSKSAHYPELIHPLSRGGSGYYYAFNASDQAGTDALEAVTAFLAERYRDAQHGIVMNWIIGNEVNVRSSWHYMQYVDLGTYAREYARAFRTMYTAIKSMNANARVYISLDQQWNRNRNSQEAYDARDMLDEFNACLSKEGNIDWGVAYHPYSVPLTWPKFWALQTDFYRSLVVDSPDTSMVTMTNIHVVTDYLQRSQFLTSSGEVRSVVLSELGYTSTYGEDVQAAAIAYAYNIAANNQHIDAFVLSRQTDAVSEIAEGLAMGICHPNGQRKYAFEVFKHLDTQHAAQYTEFAKPYIGISSWDQVIRRR